MRKTNACVAVAAIAGAMFALGMAVPLIGVPPRLFVAGTVIVSVLFVGLPILFLYSISNLKLRPAAAVTVFAIGVLMMLLIERTIPHAAFPWQAAALGSAGQIAVVLWAGSVGALVAMMFKDRNLVVPAAIMLAAIDFVIVLAPAGIVHKALQSDQGRRVFEAVAYKVPSLGHLQPAAFIGPADFLFVAMFFVVINRFEMKKSATLIAVAVALIAYLLIVLMFGQRTFAGISLTALPALVPIGVAVLIANRSEFKMNQQEKLMCWIVAGLCALMVGVTLLARTRSRPERAAQVYRAASDNLAAAVFASSGPSTFVD
jgi:hypothetical protein